MQKGKNMNKETNEVKQLTDEIGRLRERLEIAHEYNAERNEELATILDDYYWMWVIVERGKFDKTNSPEEAIDILAHSPAAPWRKDPDKWDTRDKEYNQDIKELAYNQDQVDKINAENERLRDSIINMKEVAQASFGWLIVNWEKDGELIADVVQPEFGKIVGKAKQALGGD